MAESAVVALQRDALDRRVPITDLLRKALVIAKKLRISEFETWITHELNGYGETKDVPEYRWVRGTVEAWNPYHGWTQVFFRDHEKQELLSKRPCGLAIAELENLTEKNTSGQTIQMSYSAYMEQRLRKSIDFDTEVTLMLPSSTLVRILDAVRTVVLNWAMKLEEEGIAGVGLAFNDKEKRTAGKGSYAINNFYGPVTNSQIQQQTYGSVQEPMTERLDMEVLKEILKGVKDYIHMGTLPAAAREEIEAEMKTVEAQCASPKPKTIIIKESLSSVRNVLEGTAGSILGAKLMALIQLVL